jgi:hypothetical protein
MSYTPKQIPPVPVKHSLKASLRKAEIKSFCVKYLVEHEIGSQLPRGSPEVLKFVCNVIENSINKGNKHKVDKLILCLDILAAVFPNFTQAEKDAAKGLITFMLEHKQIKRQPWKFFVRKLFIFLGARLAL